MRPTNRINDAECRDVQSLLSNYTDGVLPAFQAWNVEKHLATCGDCAEEARQLGHLVALLRDAPRRDTSDTFMASLHAILDTVDPRLAADGSLWGRLRGWLALGAESRAGRFSLIGVGAAAVVLAAVMAVSRPEPTRMAALPVAAATADGVHVSVATSASNPFTDPAADNLEFRSDGGAPAASGSL